MRTFHAFHRQRPDVRHTPWVHEEVEADYASQAADTVALNLSPGTEILVFRSAPARFTVVTSALEAKEASDG